MISPRVLQLVRIAKWAGGALIVVLVLVALVKATGAIEEVRREAERAKAAEARIIQRTVDKVAETARRERLESCLADDKERAVATRIIVRFGGDAPPEFAPRNCERIADVYAADIRAAGPQRGGP